MIRFRRDAMRTLTYYYLFYSQGKVIGSSQQTAASNAQRLQQQSLIHG